MEYIQLNDDLFIEYDENKKTSNFISKSSIQNEIDIASAQISVLDRIPSDEELLVWAKNNYSNPDMRNRAILQERIDELTVKLSRLEENHSTVTKISTVRE